jgi:hypothetical protein
MESLLEMVVQAVAEQEIHQLQQELQHRDKVLLEEQVFLVLEVLVAEAEASQQLVQLEQQVMEELVLQLDLLFIV